jgi:uncharacterized membrane protein
MLIFRTQQRFAASALLSLLVVLALVSSCSRQPRYPAPPLIGQDVAIDLAALEENVPRFFTYRFSGRNISFFVLRLQNKTLSFLDACVSCYPRKLGYRYEDGFVHCRSCDTTFSVFKLEQGFGGCYPIKVKGRVENGRYLISLAELQQHAGKF